MAVPRKKAHLVGQKRFSILLTSEVGTLTSGMNELCRMKERGLPYQKQKKKRRQKFPNDTLDTDHLI